MKTFRTKYDMTMKTDKMMKILFLTAAAAMLSVSCVKEDVRFIYQTEQQQEDDSAKASVRFCTQTPSTRSILEDEDKDSGFQVFVYRRSTGLLEGIFSFASRSGDAVKLTAGEAYDFYAVGNMWFLDGGGSRRSYSDFFDASGWSPEASPLRSSDLSNTARMPVYRFDGSSVPGGLRTETFAEIALYGIPYSGSALNVTVSDGGSVVIPCARLFSKVSVTVDHGGLVNSGVGESAFINKTIYLRQAGCRVHPFVTGIKALGPSDILAQSDYEASMTNGSALKFTFYVPENAQNVNLSMEDAQRVPDNVPSAQRDLLTYVEFTGTVDGSAGGYGGNLRYRFYIGREDAGVFRASVERGMNYNITLSFRAGSLFSPYWKVDCTDVGGLSDTRRLCFAKDAAGTTLLPDGQMLAVRKNRDGKAWIYFNRSGAAASNELSSFLDVWSSGYTPSNVSRSAYGVSYDTSLAAAYGVTVTSSGGCLTVSRSDDGRFDAHIGQVLPITLTLYPGGGSTVINAKLCENLGVSADFSDYYIGMKRNLTATGFCGSNVSLRKKSGDDGLVRFVNTPGTDGYLSSSGTQLTGTSVPLYAYRNGSAVITVASDDDFNDGEFDFSLSVLKPLPYYGDIPTGVPVYHPYSHSSVLKTAVCLPLDGTAVDVPAYFKDTHGNRILIGDAPDRFDHDVYGQVLDFEYSIPISWVGKEEDTFKMYIKKLYDSSGNFFGFYDVTPPSGKAMSVIQMIDAVNIRPRDTAIFCEPSDSKELDVCVLAPHFKADFSNVVSDYFNAWDSSWNWTRLSEADESLLKSRWPVIQNSVEVAIYDCSPGSFSMSNYGSGSSYVKNDRLRTAGGSTYLDWRFAPGENPTDCYDYRGALAPYGSQQVEMKLTNFRSSEVYSVMSNSFNVSYYDVKYRSYAYFFSGDEEAEVVWGAPLVLAWMLLEKQNNPYFDVPSSNMPAPLDAFPCTRISFQGVDDFSSGAEYGLQPYYETSSYTGGSFPMKASYRNFWMDNKTVWQFPPASYYYATWDYTSAYATTAYCQVWPHGFTFRNGGASSSTLPSAWYSDSSLYAYVKFGFDYDVHIAEYGYNNLIRQGFMVLNE